MSRTNLFCVTMISILVAGCGGQQMARTVSHEPVLLEEECRIRADGTEECRPAGALTSSGRVVSVIKATQPRIPSEIGSAVGRADAARRLAAAEIIAACLDSGGRPEACAQAAAPYSGVAGSPSVSGATGYQGQIQPYRGQQQAPRPCQSTWPMFPSLC